MSEKTSMSDILADFRNNEELAISLAKLILEKEALKKELAELKERGEHDGEKTKKQRESQMEGRFLAIERTPEEETERQREIEAEEEEYQRLVAVLDKETKVRNTTLEIREMLEKLVYRRDKLKEISDKYEAQINNMEKTFNDKFDFYANKAETLFGNAESSLATQQKNRINDELGWLTRYVKRCRDEANEI